MDLFGKKKIAELEDKLKEEREHAQTEIEALKKTVTEAGQAVQEAEHYKEAYKSKEQQCKQQCKQVEAEATSRVEGIRAHYESMLTPLPGLPTDRPLEILVVEDTPHHAEAAIAQLTALGHKVYVAKDLSEALTCFGLGKYFEGAKEPAPPQRYDVVLSDMMFPTGEKATHGFDHAQIAPLGYTVALYAARCGVPAVAIVTDMNHHDGPVATTFDVLTLDGFYGKKMAFRVDGATVVMFDVRDLPRVDREVKNWAAALNVFIAEGLGRTSYTGRPKENEQS